MTAETDLLPLPELPRQVEGYNSDYWEAGQIEEYAADYARANVEHHTAALQAEVEALREALEEIRSRSSINLAMRPDPVALTAELGNIHQIADGALEQEACRG